MDIDHYYRNGRDQVDNLFAKDRFLRRKLFVKMTFERFVAFCYEDFLPSNAFNNIRFIWNVFLLHRHIQWLQKLFIHFIQQHCFSSRFRNIRERAVNIIQNDSLSSLIRMVLFSSLAVVSWQVWKKNITNIPSIELQKLFIHLQKIVRFLRTHFDQRRYRCHYFHQFQRHSLTPESYVK